MMHMPWQAVVDTARFTSSLAAATLEDGMTLDSGPWGLGNVDVRWRYLSRAIYRR